MYNIFFVHSCLKVFDIVWAGGMKFAQLLFVIIRVPMKIRYFFLFVFIAFAGLGAKRVEPPPVISSTIDVRWYEQVIKGMTLDEKIGQLFMVAAYSNKDAAHTKQIEDLIENYHIGGLIFFQGDPLKQAYLTNYYQGISKYPLFIGIDAEWGLSMRIKPSVKYPYQLTLGSLNNDTLIYEMGKQIGLQLKALGIHINFAPVADINNNPSNPIINFRSFGENRQKVAEKAWAYAEGMQDVGVLACAKHFPGHGDTDADSHKELPLIPYSRQRLDSLELYPFRYLINRNIASIMLGHLYVPALDNRQGRPVSLSKSVVTDLLKNELGFRGLAITDAMNMKGVRNTFPAGLGELEAFLAGNHILLFPDNIPSAIIQIKKAIEDGRVTTEELNRRVLEILKWKEWAGLSNYRPIDIDALQKNLFPDDAEPLIKNIAEQSITLLGDRNGMLPLGANPQANITFIVLGNERPEDYINNIKSEFKNADIIFIKRGSTWDSYQSQINKRAANTHYVISIHQPKIWTTKTYGFSDNEIKFIQNMNVLTQSCNVFFANPYILGNFKNLKTVVMAHEDDYWFQVSAIELIKGKIPFEGIMPVSIGDYKAGTSMAIKTIEPAKPQAPVKTGNSKHKLDVNKLKSIDTIAQQIVANHAAPGCRILVLYQGEPVYDLSYGFHTYDDKEPVNPYDLYDLASVTKVAATTLAVMKLYEDGKIKLNDPIGKFLVWARNSNKEHITIRQLLLHESGLPAWIPFYKSTLGVMYDSLYKKREDSLYCVQIADRMFMKNDYRYSIYSQIIETPLGPKKYLYSDLGMVLLKEIIEQASGEPYEWYINQNFYIPMYLDNITFNPLCCYNKNRLVPTQYDQVYRKQLVQGYVHDPCAAMLGGVSGNAGLFSTAYDLAAIGQMLLNGGVYNGKRILKSETIELFTSKQNSHSRRGLGWDRPEFGNGASPSSKLASDKTFGHTGFTGTCIWVDPEYDLVYVFLSNRIFPDEENKELIKGNYRTRIQDLIYNAFIY